MLRDRAGLIPVQRLSCPNQPRELDKLSRTLAIEVEHAGHMLVRGDQRIALAEWAETKHCEEISLPEIDQLGIGLAEKALLWALPDTRHNGNVPMARDP
jgi:hypothetical protein